MTVPLTPRQWAVATLLRTMTTEAVARALNLNIHTVRDDARAIQRKAGTSRISTALARLGMPVDVWATMPPGQFRIIRLLSEGMPAVAIAAMVGVSRQAVSASLIRVKRRLGLPTNLALVLAYRDWLATNPTRNQP